MPQERKHEDAAARQRAYRERKRNAEAPGSVTPGDASEPESVTPVTEEQHEPVTPPRPTTLRGLMAAARAGTIVLSEKEERAIRHHFGFTDSEKRTYLERCAAAERMKGAVEVTHVKADGSSTVTRYTPDGTPVAEPAGATGLSLIAFPNQREGDLTPTPEEIAKLG